MYNEEYKLAYMNDIDISEISRIRYENIFNVTSKSEFLLKKDLFDMTFEELEIVFYKAQRRRANSMIAFITTIKSYIDWAKSKGYGKIKDNPIVVSINEEFVDKYLFKEGVNYFTKEDIFNAMENMLNTRDKAVTLAFFEGINGKNEFCEIKNLRVEDLIEREGKYYANLLYDDKSLETRIIEISKTLYDLLVITNNTSEIINPSSKKQRLIDSPYIFKKSRLHDKSDIKINRSNMNNIIGKFIKPSFGNVLVNITYLFQSGIMYKINEKMGNDRVLTKKIAEEILDEYNFPKQVVNDVGYYTYTSLKRVLDFDFMYEAYGEFKSEI